MGFNSKVLQKDKKATCIRTSTENQTIAKNKMTKGRFWNVHFLLKCQGSHSLEKSLNFRGSP